MAFVPAFLQAEILEHEADLVRETGSSVAAFRKEWDDLRARLHFYEPGNEPVQVRRLLDHDDLPYIATRNELGVRAIYTRDHHIGQMGAPVVNQRIDAALRNYARASTVRIGVSLGSGVVFGFSIELLPVLYRLLKSGFLWLKQQSTGVQLAIVGGVLALAIHPKVRKKFVGAWHSVAPALTDTLWSAILELGSEVVAASQASATNLREIELALPPQGRRTLLMHVRAVCVMSKRPMTIAEIEHRVRANGYISRSSNPQSYLRQVLRKSSQFVEPTPGNWALKTSTR